MKNVGYCITTDHIVYLICRSPSEEPSLRPHVCFHCTMSIWLSHMQHASPHVPLPSSSCATPLLMCHSPPPHVPLLLLMCHSPPHVPLPSSSCATPLLMCHSPSSCATPSPPHVPLPFSCATPPPAHVHLPFLTFNTIPFPSPLPHPLCPSHAGSVAPPFQAISTRGPSAQQLKNTLQLEVDENTPQNYSRLVCSNGNEVGAAAGFPIRVSTLFSPVLL